GCATDTVLRRVRASSRRSQMGDLGTDPGYSNRCLTCPHGRECGVGRGRGVTLGGSVGVDVGIAVGVGVGEPPGLLGVGLGLGGGVVVGVAVGVGLGGIVAVAVGVAVGVGDGVPPPCTAARISTRPHPYTLLGGPASPHSVELMCTAALF